MAQRRRVAIAGALGVLVLALVHEALAPATFHHPRTPLALLLMAALALAVLLVAPRAPSGALALGAGVAAGGALANLVAALLWRSGIPDPIVRGGYAFNLADVAVVLGDAALLTAAVVLAWDNRARLLEPLGD